MASTIDISCMEPYKVSSSCNALHPIVESYDHAAISLTQSFSWDDNQDD